MTGDLHAVSATSTAQMLPTDQRVGFVGWQVVGTAATDGTVVLRTGGASGAVRMTIYTGPDSVDSNTLPGRILFEGGLHATLTNVDGFTAIYE